jgi:lysophospholipase L1-like esterase
VDRERAGRLLILWLLSAAAIAGWWLYPRVDPRTTPTAGRTIVAFGDSLVDGIGATPGRDFVSLLAARTGVPIVNAGRAGDTTADALARLDRDVLARDPRVVIVLLGGNDFLRRVPRERTFENLSRIVERIRARGAGVILAGVSLGLLVDTYADGYDDIARRTSSVLVPDVLGGILGRAGMTVDQIHPNDRGYALVADRIEPALRAMLR